MNWTKHFPFPSVRGQQQDALDRIHKAFWEDGHDNVIAELGTGIGKSAIAVALGNYVRENHGGATYILTSQKTLQDQYLSDFPGITTDIRSSSNFVCSWLEAPCSETIRLKRILKRQKGTSDIIKCDRCPYQETKQQFKDGSIGVTNYSYYLSETVYAGGLEPRYLLIMDEAHNIEGEVRRWATLRVNEKFCEKELKIKLPEKEDDVLHFIGNEYIISLAAYVAKLGKKLESAVKRKLSITKITEIAEHYESMDKHICQVNRFISSVGGSRYVPSLGNDEHGAYAEVKPFHVGYAAHDLLYKSAVKRLFLSATILDENVFSRSTGVENKKLISIPSPFPYKSYGVTYSPVVRVTKDATPADYNKLKERISQIISLHPNEKGIIHTSNYNITKLVGTIKNPRLLVQIDSSNRDEIIAKHKTSREPTILVSPAMMEGLDLKDDLGRFQVVCKVPYPYLGDKLILEKFRADPKWYAWITIRSIVQSIGRCVRNENDHAKTYILDECFGDLFVKWHSMFPEFFAEMSVSK